MSLIQMDVPFGDPLDELQKEAHGRPRFDVLFKGPPPTGDELKEEGIKRSLQKEKNRQYRNNLVETLKIFPVRSRITSEQLTGIVGRPEIFGATNSSVGAAINFMAKKGLIQKTGKMLKPGRKERHSNPIPEWEVLKYA